MSEWRDVPTGEIIAFAEAVKAGDEIEVWTSCGWREWSRDSWVSNWRYRARSKPKTRQVQLRGFITTYGQLTFYAEGSINYDSALNPRSIRRSNCRGGGMSTTEELRAQVQHLQMALADTEALEMEAQDKVLAQQARIEQLLEAVEYCCSQVQEFITVPGISKALSTPDDLSALRAHDEKLLAPYQWQPIETAPKDGTAVLALIEGSDIPQSVRYRKGGWRICWDDYRIAGLDGPTNWMPIPSADAIEKGGVK